MIYVLKLGGGAGVQHASALQNLAERVRSGEQWIVVHGASHATNQLATQMNIPVRTITSPNGHVSRYTDSAMIEIYQTAVASLNQALCTHLATLGVMPLSFAHPEIIIAQRKSAIRAIQNGRPVIIRDDFSGRITDINAQSIHVALAMGYVPVIAPIALSALGEALNVDGDLVAANIARELAADTLVILSNVPGLLRDVNDSTSLIPSFSLNMLPQYESYAAGRMKKKLLAAQEANLHRVILADSRLPNPLNVALNGAGTHITQGELYVR